MIDTGNHALISVPPYRMTAANKDKLTIELGKLLQDEYTVNCKSAWFAVVVFVGKKQFN